MSNILINLNRIMGLYKPGHEYWVNISRIHIPSDWRQTEIGANKWNRKLNYWRNTGNFESKIKLDRNFNLIDGYSSIKIAEFTGIDKVPVWFIN